MMTPEINLTLLTECCSLIDVYTVSKRSAGHVRCRLGAQIHNYSFDKQHTHKLTHTEVLKSEVKKSVFN